METLKEYKETINVWGREKEVTITIKTKFDNDYFMILKEESDKKLRIRDTPLEAYGEYVGEFVDKTHPHALEKLKEELRDRLKLILDIEKGNLSVDIIFVEVKCDLFSGTDCLGGCMVELHSKYDHLSIVNDHNMVNEAIDDYRTNVKKYKDFFEA